MSPPCLQKCQWLFQLLLQESGCLREILGQAALAHPGALDWQLCPSSPRNSWGLEAPCRKYTTDGAGELVLALAKGGIALAITTPAKQTNETAQVFPGLLPCHRGTLAPDASG